MFLSFDQQIVELFASLRNPILTYFMKDVSFLGSSVFIFLLIIGFYVFKKRHTDSWKLSIAFFLSVISSIGLKYIFARPRPELAIYSGIFYAFPSTHATLGFSIAYVLCDIYKHKSKAKFYFYSIAILIAISRVYLGVHYFTDVLFGSLLGILIGFLVVKCFNKYGYFCELT
ncbi:MAG: phosphatase PAP2 family protein [Candidatus Aenigmatarchaeota archaeon]